MFYPDYNKAVDKADKCKEKIFEQYPDLEQLMEEYANAQMKQTELRRTHEFSVDVRVEARLVLTILKKL